MPMDQREYERRLQGLVKFIKTNEPQGNPSEKKSRSDDGMVVVVKVLPQGPCGDCGRRCKKQRFCSHRRDRNGVWQSHCQECGLYRNPETGKYEPRQISEATAKKKAQAEQARLRQQIKDQKTSERTKSLLQRLTQILHQSVPKTNDHSGD